MTWLEPSRLSVKGFLRSHKIEEETPMAAALLNHLGEVLAPCRR
jgi:hypothetical protein